jgi:hypothetical protein
LNSENKNSYCEEEVKGRGNRQQEVVSNQFSFAVITLFSRIEKKEGL